LAASTSKSGSETIVVVDDDPTVLNACCSALRWAGYRVLSATGGESALTFFEPDQTPVDLTLIDVVMPGINGIELAKRLKTISSGTKILLMSGYSPADIERLTGEDGAAFDFVWKPFEIKAFLQIISNVLDRPGTEAVGRATAKS